MKNQKIVWTVIAVVVIIVIIFLISRGSGSATSSYGQGSNVTSGASGASGTSGSTNTPAPVVTAPVGTTTAVTSTTKNYQNPELGFSVDYPKTWALSDADSGPTFTIPTNGSSGIYTLQAQMYFVPDTCAFPPVATSSITGKSTLADGSLSFNMIKVSTTAQSKTSLDEMYTLDQGTAKDPSCYVFSFASTAAAPVSAANQSTINAAAKAFTSMVQSFAIVTGPAGQSETAHPNGN